MYDAFGRAETRASHGLLLLDGGSKFDEVDVAPILYERRLQLRDHLMSRNLGRTLLLRACRLREPIRELLRPLVARVAEAAQCAPKDARKHRLACEDRDQQQIRPQVATRNNWPTK